MYSANIWNAPTPFLLSKVNVTCYTQRNWNNDAKNINNYIWQTL